VDKAHYIFEKIAKQYVGPGGGTGVTHKGTGKGGLPAGTNVIDINKKKKKGMITNFFAKTAKKKCKSKSKKVLKTTTKQLVKQALSPKTMELARRARSTRLDATWKKMESFRRKADKVEKHKYSLNPIVSIRARNLHKSYQQTADNIGKRYLADSDKLSRTYRRMSPRK